MVLISTTKRYRPQMLTVSSSYVHWPSAHSQGDSTEYFKNNVMRLFNNIHQNFMYKPVYNGNSCHQYAVKTVYHATHPQYMDRIRKSRFWHIHNKELQKWPYSAINACLPVHPHIIIKKLLNILKKNLILPNFTKICQDIPILVKLFTWTLTIISVHIINVTH